MHEKDSPYSDHSTSVRGSTRAHNSRYWLGRAVRHIIIMMAVSLCTVVFWLFFSARHDLISHLSVATAYPALFLTAAALLLGPLNVITGRRNPVSFDLRRDVGIWSGIMALLHTAVGLNVHLRGRPWLYFIDQHHRVRIDLFGFANDTGLITVLIFLLLLAISNDLSLRRLGARRWKSLQRWTYAGALLTFLHAVAYQRIEKRQLAYEAVLWSTAAMITVLQVVGWRSTSRRYGRMLRSKAST